jgi:hypothetical protein
MTLERSSPCSVAKAVSFEASKVPDRLVVI